MQNDFVLFQTQDGYELNQYIGNNSNIYVPNEVDGCNITSIGERAFNGLKHIEKITLADGIVSIQNGAFSNCSNLKSITLPDTVKNIGTQAKGKIAPEDGAFFNTAICEVNLPLSVQYIGAYAFAKTRLRSLSLPDNITYIGKSAFEGCEDLDIVKLPEQLITLENALFRNCSKLKEIIFPNELHYIKSSVFSGAHALTKLSLPLRLLEIGTACFTGCKNLHDLFIPFTVVKIGDTHTYGYLSEYSSSAIPTKITVHCHPLSFTSKYCKAKKIKVINWEL